MVKKFSGNSDSDELGTTPVKTVVKSDHTHSDENALWPYSWLHWEGHCNQQSDQFLKLTPLATECHCQLSNTKIFARGGSFQDMCGELRGTGQNRPVQRPPLPLTFYGERFATLETLTVAVPRTPNFQHSWLPDCRQWTHRSLKCYFFSQNLFYSQQSLPFASSYVYGYPWLSKKMKIAEKKSKSTKKL